MNSESNHIIFTNKSECRDCYRCVRVCPVNAIRLKNGQAQVVAERCIGCGTCINNCPQNAKQYRRDVDIVEDLLKTDKKLAISLAPSYVSAYEKWQWERLPSALRQGGFALVSETAVGAWEVAVETARLAEEKKETWITSSCPAVVSFIEKYKSGQSQAITPVVSPMVAHARILKNKYKADKVIFAGPCTAKKMEAERDYAQGLVDAVLTFAELDELLERLNLDLSRCENSKPDIDCPEKARLFPIDGGLLKTAYKTNQKPQQHTLTVSGYEDLEDALAFIEKSDKHYLVEALFCDHGCINGPVMRKGESNLEKTQAVEDMDQTKDKESNNPDTHLAPGDIKAKFKANPVKQHQYSEEEIRKVLQKTGKYKNEQELNCGACGYITCREKAIAVLDGMAEEEMCIPYMRQMAEQRADTLIERDPNGILFVNDKLEITRMNPAFKKLFSTSDTLYGKQISYLFDPSPFETVKQNPEEVYSEIIHLDGYNLICHLIVYAIDEDQIVGVWGDITKDINNSEKIKTLKTDVVSRAEELVKHQNEMARQLAQSLGEYSAQGEIILQKLLKEIKK